jgi:hypothetical protein
MTPLVLSLALTAPAQQPLIVPPPVVVQPRVVVQPQLPSLFTYRPPTYLSVPVVPVAPQALTLGEFSRFFTPTPGKHDVWVVHPSTRQPVKVCFTLPPGKLREFDVTRHAIRFEFSHGHEVDIVFHHNGTVNVRYRN